MSDKYVKDGAHNRFPAYCCEDIDKIVGKLVEDVAALVAGTVPDGAVTLAKLAADARTYSRELNKGLLTAEWIGTRAEYEAHVEENNGSPLANVKYIITDDEQGARITTDAYAVGSLVAAMEVINGEDMTSYPQIGDTCDSIVLPVLTYLDGATQKHPYAFTSSDAAENYSMFRSYETEELKTLSGTWRLCGVTGTGSLNGTATNLVAFYELWQRVG